MTKVILPMLAKPFEDRYLSNLKYVYIQPKLDGQRALYYNNGLWSRTAKPILNVPHIVEECKRLKTKYVLDGELYLHGKSLQEIISDTRKTVNLEENDIEYHVYDLAIEKLSFEERYELLTKIIPLNGKIKLVYTSKRPANSNQLDPFSPCGYEGSMVRNPDGLYKFGKRSSDLLKIKDFLDAEFELIGITELSSKDKVIVPDGTPGSKKYADGRSYKDGLATPMGTMGSLICKTKDGKEFEVGTGFTDDMREEFWNNFKSYKGQLVTVKYQKFTKDKIPFLPVFVCIGDDK